jgi:hypothetical protein
MIQITCTTHQDDEPTPVFRTTGVPAALACASSSRLLELCERSQIRVFNFDEIVSEPTAEKGLIGDDFHTHMTSFVKWLYDADLKCDGTFCCDRWYLGQKLRFPRFQNAAIQDLCKRPNADARTIGFILSDLYPPF